MEETKLKPCPFCGGEADLWRKETRFGYISYCECAVCGAESRSFPVGETQDWDTHIGASRACDAWNRRVGND